MKLKTICIFIVDRANYGRLKPVMNGIKNDKRFKMQLVCTGTTLLEKYGNVSSDIEKDGFEITSKIYMEYAGSNQQTMAMGIGTGILLITNELAKLKPDIVLIIGDRYEALAAVIAAAYSNIRIAHIQGGEVSGSIDESARHAITKFSHIHFPSTELAKERIIKMGEDPDFVICSGCPSKDLIKNENNNVNHQKELIGVGNIIDVKKKFLLVSYHPTTTQKSEIDELNINLILKALELQKMQCIWLWPNIDAGSDQISKQLRKFRETNINSDDWLTLIKNVRPEVYAWLMSNAKCLIGNSSSFVRDSGFLGTPVLLISERQKCREHGKNVLPLGNLNSITTIKEALELQLKSDFKINDIYGKENTTETILNSLYNLEPDLQKSFIL